MFGVLCDMCQQCVRISSFCSLCDVPFDLGINICTSSQVDWAGCVLSMLIMSLIAKISPLFSINCKKKLMRGNSH